MKKCFFILVSLFFLSCGEEDIDIGNSNNLNSLINLSNEIPGNRCTTGGVKIETGQDLNSDGILSADEIQQTQYVCNGNNSLTNITNVISDENCENGGINIDLGIDSNSNGILDSDEINSTAFICNGFDGNSNLTNINNEPSGTNCENGGLKIDTGIDINNNGILESNEILSTDFACNGMDGYNSLVNVIPELAGENCENGGTKIETGLDISNNGILESNEILSTSYVCAGFSCNLENELTNHYLFNGSNEDSSGNEFEIDFFNISYDNNESILFNGSNSYVNIESEIDPTETDWTFSVWFKLNELPSNKGDAFLLSRENLTTNSDDLYLYIDNDNIIKSWIGDSTSKISSEFTVSNNLWYHIVITYSNEIISYYINGELVKILEANFTSKFSLNENFAISNIYANGIRGSQGRFDGLLDNIRLYNKVLSEKEVNCLFETEGSLSSY